MKEQNFNSILDSNFIGSNIEQFDEVYSTPKVSTKPKLFEYYENGPKKPKYPFYSPVVNNSLDTESKYIDILNIIRICNIGRYIGTTYNDLGDTIVHLACKFGDDYYDIVHGMVKLNADINVTNLNNQNPLLYAVQSRFPCIKIIQKLLQAGANAQLQDKFGTAIIHSIIKNPNQNQDYILTLVNMLKSHVDINLPNLDKETPLIIAVAANYTKVVHSLLQSPDLKLNNITVQDKFGDTALHISVNNGNIKLTELMLQYIGYHKINPNLINSDKNTALHIASNQGKVDLVRLLLEYKCDASMLNDEGETAAHIVARYINSDNNLQILKMLKYQCENILYIRNPLTNFTPMDFIIQYGTVKSILTFGVEQNILYNILFDAYNKKNTKLIHGLLEEKMDPNLTDWENNTLLHVVIDNIVDVLTNPNNVIKSTLSKRIYCTNSPQDINIIKNDVKIIKTLCMYDANIWIQNNQGTTPFDKIYAFENYTLQKILLQSFMNNSTFGIKGIICAQNLLPESVFVEMFANSFLNNKNIVKIIENIKEEGSRQLLDIIYTNFSNKEVREACITFVHDKITEINTYNFNNKLYILSKVSNSGLQESLLNLKSNLQESLLNLKSNLWKTCDNITSENLIKTKFDIIKFDITKFFSTHSKLFNSLSESFTKEVVKSFVDMENILLKTVDNTELTLQKSFDNIKNKLPEIFFSTESKLLEAFFNTESTLQKSFINIKNKLPLSLVKLNKGNIKMNILKYLFITHENENICEADSWYEMVESIKCNNSYYSQIIGNSENYYHGMENFDV